MGELVRRTGVPAATIRMWEARHGFPPAIRLTSGHRRYTDEAVDLVRAVIERKAAGRSLPMAIADATRGASAPSPSVQVELRKRHPEIARHLLRKRSLVALSHALEDEATAAAQRPWLIGCFQQEAYYRQAQPRWHDMARTSSGAWVMAEFKRTRRTSLPAEVRLPSDADLTREWVVVCVGDELPFCVAAVELPGQQDVPDQDRQFETMWSLDPLAVADAARSCVRTLVALGHEPGELADLVDTWSGSPVSQEKAERVYARIVTYVDRSHAL